MKKILFIDRDGTLIKEPYDYRVDSFEKLEFYPEVFYYLKKIVAELDFELVMVTNQDGLGTDEYPEAVFNPIQDFIIKSFKNEAITFNEILIDKSYPEAKLPTRKPGVGMLLSYLNNPEYDLKNSFVIGDRLTDVELAKNIECRAIFINGDKELGSGELSVDTALLQQSIALETADWKSVYTFLKLPQRTAVIKRKTKETEVNVKLNIDGNGKSDITTGIAFFDHMLEQIARHAELDLEIKVIGDLEVDEHHTIEDTAITLGMAFAAALSDKLGMERYGFVLPMDDCLAQVAVDFGGRSWLVWDADFKREYVGKMPTEMFFHFFKSFTDEARINLNIKAEGTNEHHKIEAIFKAFAKAIKMALKRNPDKMTLPSTKELL